MPRSDWTAQQLAEFLSAVSSAESEAAAARAAVERAAEALDAEVAAIVCGGHVVAAVGYPEHAAPAGELGRVTTGPDACELAVPGVGICAATGVALQYPPGATLVLARSGPDELGRAEGALLRGMARVASMTLQMLRLLEDERGAREESDRQATENARLLATLRDRQRVLERLAAEQAALRRVATLVAGQTASQDIFAVVAEEVGRLLGADLAGVCRYESGGAMTVLPAWSSGALEVLPAGQRIPLDGASVAAAVLRSGRAARVDDYTAASGAIGDRMRELGVRSSMGAPIVVDGRMWGTMIVSTTRSEPFPPDGDQRLSAFTELVATAISNAASREQLAASRARIVATADETRRRIERDLHDGIQQRLVTLGYELGTLAELTRGQPQDVRARIARMEQGLTDAHDELREIARGVHPAILSKGGLGPALRWLARRSPLAVTLDVEPVPRLPEAVEVAAYYVACEALANAAKHAEAGAVKLHMTLADEVLSVSIRDDGVGGVDRGQGSGIVGLIDRVEALDGTLHVTSPPGEGTSITADLPIEVTWVDSRPARPLAPAP